VLGASNYTYAEATWTQTLPDWIEAHVRMFPVLWRGCHASSSLTIWKSGVHRASFYDPEINRSYGMMASHYGVGVLPARPRKPRDKAKSGSRSAFCPRPISSGGFRRQTFFSLAEANAAIAAALERNQRPRHAPAQRQPPTIVRDRRDACPGAVAGCRLSVSRNGSWPASSLDYHVEVDGFFYSVPHGPDPGAGSTFRAHHPDHRVVSIGVLRVAAHQASLWRPPARH